MNTQKLNKWGNGQGFRINKKTIKALNLEIGDQVEYHIENNKLIIEPIVKKKILTEEYLISQLSKKSFDDLNMTLLPEEYDV